jgi:flavin-dependent dehydrogenase
MLAVRAYFDNINGPGRQADVYYSSNSFPGYYWLFPTGETTANVGVGIVNETFPENQLHLNELLRDIIEKDPALRHRIGKGVLRGKITGWPLSPSTQICRLWRQGSFDR